MVAHREGQSFLVIPQHSGPVMVEHSSQDDVGWCRPPVRLFRCEVRLCAEPEGGYSVYAPELPGVVSEGDSALEATRNMAEALGGALAAYLEDSGQIPWKRDTEPLAPGESRLWIVANA